MGIAQEAGLPEMAAPLVGVKIGVCWLDEPVPALGGLTPWQAAADPTRRDELARLLATFPDPDSPLLMLRPAHLRQQLGLPELGHD